MRRIFCTTVLTAVLTAFPATSFKNKIEQNTAMASKQQLTEEVLVERARTGVNALEDFLRATSERYGSRQEARDAFLQAIDPSIDWRGVFGLERAKKPFVEAVYKAYQKKTGKKGSLADFCNGIDEARDAIAANDGKTLARLEKRYGIEFLDALRAADWYYNKALRIAMDDPARVAGQLFDGRNARLVIDALDLSKPLEPSAAKNLKVQVFQELYNRMAEKDEDFQQYMGGRKKALESKVNATGVFDRGTTSVLQNMWSYLNNYASYGAEKKEFETACKEARVDVRKRTIEGIDNNFAHAVAVYRLVLTGKWDNEKARFLAEKGAGTPAKELPRIETTTVPELPDYGTYKAPWER